MSFQRAIGAAFALIAVGCTHYGNINSAAINDSRYNTNFAELNRLVDQLCIQSRLEIEAFDAAATARGMAATKQTENIGDGVLSSYDFRGGSIYLFDGEAKSSFPDMQPGRTCGVALRTRGSLDFESEIITPLTLTMAATSTERTQYHHGSTWLFKRSNETIGQFLVAGPSPPDIGIQIFLFENSRIEN